MYSRGGKTFSKEAMHSSYTYFIENHSNRYPEVLRWTLFAGSEFCKIFFLVICFTFMIAHLAIQPYNLDGGLQRNQILIQIYLLKRVPSRKRCSNEKIYFFKKIDKIKRLIHIYVFWSFLAKIPSFKINLKLW